MKIFYKLSNNIIKVYLLIFCISVFFIFDANYSADSLRYVFAGMQFVENYFFTTMEPNISSKLYDSAFFHSNISYSFPKREFFTIIPNLTFYGFSILFEDSLDYFIIFNLLIYSSIFIYCANFYKFNNNLKGVILLIFLFFGHYQIAGWNIKILPEIMYFCTLIFFLIKLINFKGLNQKDILIIIILSVFCFLIRPQGIIFIFVSLFFLIGNKLFMFKISRIILYLFLFNLFFFPFILFLDVNEYFNFPIISKENTGLLDGAIISGWINYYKGDLIFQNIRFNDKQFNFEQTYNYLDLLKITLYRLYYFISPYKYYQSIFLNTWNVFYFLLIYIIAINYLIKMNDNLKKNLFIFLIVSVLSFHLLFPVTGTFRYQLSLIAIIFVLNFEYLNIKFIKNE